MVAPLSESAGDWKACFETLVSVLDPLQDECDVLPAPFARLASQNEQLAELLSEQAESLRDAFFHGFSAQSPAVSDSLLSELLRQYPAAAAQSAACRLQHLVSCLQPPVEPRQPVVEQQQQQQQQQDKLNWQPDTQQQQQHSGRSDQADDHAEQQQQEGLNEMPLQPHHENHMASSLLVPDASMQATYASRFPAAVSDDTVNDLRQQKFAGEQLRVFT